uniref:Uncharacterized protein n=1 Tax=Laticauda laticaudata TaxID=8630 RepID=A0A8C5SCG2_LATLA
MGGGESKSPTPLGAMLKHFRKAYESQDYGLEWSRHKLQVFCEGEWPTFEFGWPPAGTLDIPIAVKVHQLVFHPTLVLDPDQAPYIDVWLNRLNHPPPWLKQLKMQRCKVLLSCNLSLKGGKKAVQVLPSCPEELPPPPPYVPPFDLKSVSEGDESSGVSGLMSRPTHPQGPRLKCNSYRFEAEPVVARTRAKTEQASLIDPAASVTLPLFQHVMKVDAHNPTWLDLQQLMGTLFNSEEREKIKNAVSEILKQDVRVGGNLATYVKAHFPSQDPKWDPYNHNQMEDLHEYQSLVAWAIHLAGKLTVNMSKSSLVLLEPTESPEALYTRLIDAYCMYTPTDATDLDNAWMLTMAFISQSAPDICRKLRWLEENGTEADRVQTASQNLWSS